MILEADGSQKKPGIAILISDKLDFKPKEVTRDKGGHFMIKGIMHQESITVINIYAPNIGTSKYIKQLLPDLKEEMDTTQ